MVNFEKENELDEIINEDLEVIADQVDSDNDMDDNMVKSDLEDVEVVREIEMNYLDPSIIDIQVVDKEKLKEYEDYQITDEEFDYIDTISTIKEKDVVDGLLLV
jgi:hypothetical protein